MRGKHHCLLAAAALCVWLLMPSVTHAAPSVCYGRPGHGKLEHGVRLPLSGDNFAAYSTALALAGRTYVHDRVAGVVLAAYRILAMSRPDTRFVYGETGWPSGGRFRPHRTHQNGLSVDFMVPVLDAHGRSQLLPTAASNGYGYGLAFDQLGRLDGYQVDFDAMAEHLLALHAAAKAAGVGIEPVIEERAHLPLLYATPHGAELKRRVRFFARKPWVRHDDHYHVDFAVPCRRYVR